MNQYLEKIRKQVITGKQSRRAERNFAGAELVIKKERNELNESLYRNDIIVYTKYSKELSALIEDIRDAMKAQIDYFNKYDFYPMLGEAANNYLKDSNNLEGLLLSVVDTAIEYERKLNTLYFAYGSNMDINQMAKRCPGAQLLEKATLPNYEFSLDEAGVATVIPNVEKRVEGLLWLISPLNRDSLDYYEGVANGCYRQEWLQVVNADGEEVYALHYISERGPNNGERRPEYLEKVIKAGTLQGLSEDYLEELEEWQK